MDKANQVWGYFYKPPACPSLGLADNLPGVHAAMQDAIDLCYADGWKDCGIFCGLCIVVAFVGYQIWKRNQAGNS